MWIVEYDNMEIGEGLHQWWNVTDGQRVFRCDDGSDAEWLCNLLNSKAGRIDEGDLGQ